MAEQKKVRCNMYLPVKLVEKIDKGCEETGLNRTEYVVHVLLNYFDQQQALELIDVVKQANKE